MASVGVLACRTLPFTNSNKAIKTFRHALSLDEVSTTALKLDWTSLAYLTEQQHRAKFKPNYYHHPTKKPQAPAQPDAADNNVVFGSFRSTNSLIQKLKRGSGRLKRFCKREFEMMFVEESPDEDEGIPDTDVLEVWFSGCHTGKCYISFVKRLKHWLCYIS